jgi:hypothetical protein
MQKCGTSLLSSLFSSSLLLSFVFSTLLASSSSLLIPLLYKLFPSLLLPPSSFLFPFSFLLFTLHPLLSSLYMHLLLFPFLLFSPPPIHHLTTPPQSHAGISAGSGLLARYMGDQGKLGHTAASPTAAGFVGAALGVCPGYDIEVCMGRMAQPYQAILVALWKRSSLEPFAGLLSKCLGYDACLAAGDMQVG